MASAFAHTLVALTLGKAAAGRKMPARFWVLAAVCSCLPDADVIGFAFGIRYDDLLGHRGLSHSFAFALAVGFVVTVLAFRETPALSRGWWGLVGFFTLVTASHGVLDAMTDGGLGIAFFSPFDPTRYFFPVRPVVVSPIGVGAFFSDWGMRVIVSEIVWIWLPSLLLMSAVLLVRRLRQGESK